MCRHDLCSHLAMTSVRILHRPPATSERSYYRALYTYESADPNDLPFEEGDVIIVSGCVVIDGVEIRCDTLLVHGTACMVVDQFLRCQIVSHIAHHQAMLQYSVCILRSNEHPQLIVVH